MLRPANTWVPISRPSATSPGAALRNAALQRQSSASRTSGIAATCEAMAAAVLAPDCHRYVLVESEEYPRFSATIVVPKRTCSERPISASCCGERLLPPCRAGRQGGQPVEGAAVEQMPAKRRCDSPRDGALTGTTGPVNRQDRYRNRHACAASCPFIVPVPGPACTRQSLETTYPQLLVSITVNRASGDRPPPPQKPSPPDGRRHSRPCLRRVAHQLRWRHPAVSFQRHPRPVRLHAAQPSTAIRSLSFTLQFADAVEPGNAVRHRAAAQ